MTNITSEYPFITELFIYIAIIIIVFQFYRISRYKAMFQKLSEVFNAGKKVKYNDLVDKIIRSGGKYISGPESKAVELILNSVKELFENKKIFIHVTNNKIIADKILTDGFKYSDDFFKSSEEISNNPVDLTYKLQLYKNYGHYVIIMCIPNELLKPAKNELESENLDLLAQYGISEHNPKNELSYKLPSSFVKGYINVKTMEIVNNSVWAKK